jgi:hypothetical protein
MRKSLCKTARISSPPSTPSRRRPSPPIIRPVLPHLLCSIRAVINLEAAGTTGPELLFQATSEEMIRAYSKVPYPLGTVVATDTFKTGVMLSEYAALILCRTPVALIRYTARTSGSSFNT